MLNDYIYTCITENNNTSHEFSYFKTAIINFVDLFIFLFYISVFCGVDVHVRI